MQSNSAHIRQLFFAYQPSIKLLEDFPHVFLADCTYKTNRFKMPLFCLVGMISLNTTFHLGFTFLSEEKEDNYVWALGCVKDIYAGFTQVRPGSAGLQGPPVIVVDCDIALINAIR